MKKSLLVILLIIAVSLCGFAQSITVTSPAGTDSWEIGSSHNITWTKSGTMNGNVKIRLYNESGSVRILGITDSTANNGMFRNWVIPESVPAGRYVIRVKTVDNLVSDDSSVFSITGHEPVIPPEINITSPSSSSRWNRGSTKTINWTTSGTIDSRVRIRLMDEAGTSEIQTIINNTSNDGTYAWSIPETLSSGRYRVKIQTIDNEVTRNSPIFNITAAPSLTLPENRLMETRRYVPRNLPPVIKVIYPNGGETLTRGSRVEIRWECVDGFNPPRIKIQKGGRTIRTYGPNGLYPVPSRGGYIWPWFIPSDLTPGSDYKIRIEKGDFSRSNDKSDGNFTISSDINIEVVDPRGGGLIVTNGRFIRWRIGGVEGNVNVHLKRANGRGGLQPIRLNIPGTPGSFLWHVGSLERIGTISNGESYKIVVSAADGSATGESNSFRITVPTLEVLSPGSSRKSLGDTLNIRWNNSPGFQGNVNVILEQQTQHSSVEYQTLFSNTRNKNLNWRIPPRSRYGEIDPFPTHKNYRIVVRSARCPQIVVARGPWFEVR